MSTENPARQIMTMVQHVSETERQFSDATGVLSSILSGIELATNIIQSRVRRAGLVDILGAMDRTNVHGEIVQKLDAFAEETIESCLQYRVGVGLMLSEEHDEPKIVREPGADGAYVVLFDPLDGSSNIDVNVSIGTIFSILKCLPESAGEKNPERHFLQPGAQQVAAGYVVYGSSTVMVYTTHNVRRVHLFTLDPSIGAFVLHEENLRMPATGKSYSVNEAYFDSFPEGVQKYLRWTKAKESGGYSQRYIGSLVADFHRTLLKGGVFLYPPTAKNPDGKLRLLYEANPLAMIAEHAGGVATDFNERILDKQPVALHQRTPLLIGSKDEVDRVMKTAG